MNQIQQLIESIRDAPHDALVVAGMFAVPVLIGLWIVKPYAPPGARLAKRACYSQRGIRCCAVGI